MENKGWFPMTDVDCDGWLPGVNPHNSRLAMQTNIVNKHIGKGL